MPIFISPSLVLSPTTEFPAWSPMIGWSSVLSPSTLEASSEDPQFPASNLGNVSTVEVWKATSTAAQTLTVTPPGMQEIDYIGIARHNLGSANIAFSVERFDGTNWIEIVEAALVGSDEPIIIRFASNAGAPTRLRLEAGDVPAMMAVMYCGKGLILPPNIEIGYTPINYGRRYDEEEDVSESGNFLGRIILGEWRQSTPRLSYIDGDWYRAHMDAFVAVAMRRPFFWAWDPLHYPSEVGYCWIRKGSVVEPVIHTNAGHMQIDLPMRGIAA